MSTVIWIGTDEGARRSGASYLQEADFELETARDVLGALRLVYERRPDAAIIDSRLTDIGGVEFTHVLRAIASEIAIVMVSEVSDSRAAVTALDQGADDYLTKPFGGAELVVRVRAAVRRAARARQPLQLNLVVSTGELVFDREARIVTKAGNVIHLTPTEFRLFEALAGCVGRVAPHRFLLSTVWGDEFVDDIHYLRIYIGYLRQKIENDPSQPEYLLNEWGTGYRLASLPAVEPRLLAPAYSGRAGGDRRSAARSEVSLPRRAVDREPSASLAGRLSRMRAG